MDGSSKNSHPPRHCEERREKRGWAAWHGAVRGLLALVACLVPMLGLSGCEQTATLRGKVLDIQGQRLPGVSITIPGGPATTTDARGEYRLRVAPANLHLDFHKTGYTGGWLELDVTSTTVVEADDIQLWPLPESKGVYLFQDFRYQALDRTEPKRYVQGGNRNIFGVMRAPNATTTQTNPLLIAHRLPTYDVRAHRIEKTEAALPTATTGTPAETVWAPREEIPIIASPIDEPERQLIDLRFERPLAPGDYAIHWGAFEGYTTTDTRAFLLHIAGPNEATVEAPVEPAVESKPKTDDKKAPDPDPGVSEF